MTRRHTTTVDPSHLAANTEQHIPPGKKIEFEKLLPGRKFRHDGWTNERLQRFIDTLAYTGCVRDSAGVAGVSDTSIYKLKKRYPSFAAVWDDALARSQKGLIAVAYRRAVEGKETVVIRNGEEVERRIVPSDSILSLLIKRGDLTGERAKAKGEDVLTFEEWKSGLRFTKWGKKWKPPSPEEAQAKLDAKFKQMRQRLFADADERGVCTFCDAPLKPGVTNEMLRGG
jgi:hypothetical protein